MVIIFIMHFLACLDTSRQSTLNTTHLSEGIHSLLGDCITELDLERAESLLHVFYREFS